MILVLSAFNGFEGLLRKVYHFQDPDFRIEARQGKFFQVPDKVLADLKGIEGISGVFQVLRDKASLQYGDGQMVVEVVGIDPDLVKVSRLDTSVKQGTFSLKDGDLAQALISVGIRNSLNISLKDNFTFLKLQYPKRKKVLQMGSGKIFNQVAFAPTGIVQMDEIRMYAPLSKVRQLMDKPSGMNSLDIYLHPSADQEKIRSGLEEKLGSGYSILDENQQHADLYKVLRIEKLFVFLALGFLILISTFNLFVSSTMLVLEKQKDIRIFTAMGLSPRKVGQVIQASGAIIAFTGLCGGLIFGLAICWIQIAFGLVPLGMETTLIDAYPIEVQWKDLMAVGIWVLVSGGLAVLVPARKAEAFARNTL